MPSFINNKAEKHKEAKQIYQPTLNELGMGWGHIAFCMFLALSVKIAWIFSLWIPHDWNMPLNAFTKASTECDPVKSWQCSTMLCLSKFESIKCAVKLSRDIGQVSALHISRVKLICTLSFRSLSMCVYTVWYNWGRHTSVRYFLPGGVVSWIKAG